MTGPSTIAWWRDGEAHLDRALSGLAGQDLDGPSLLPGWDRRRVVAHVARNADALVNLLIWARTGRETPMYASAEARDAAIADTARLPAADLLADSRAAARRLLDAADALPEHAWAVEVRTAQGRTVPASEVPWMRCREVWVHAVDLDSGPGFDDVPDEVLAALIDDVHRAWDRRGQTPEVRLASGDRTWGKGPVTASGPLPDLAAWVSGRAGPGRVTSPDALPALPAWL